MTTTRKRRALVTGAAGGIGSALAEAFVRDGYDVILHDVNEEGGERARHLGAYFIKADLANPNAVEYLAREALSGGGVDVLVNNAGFQHVATVEEFPTDVWQRMIQVMLTAPFQLTKACLPGMRAGGWGRIINVASIHGLVASSNKAAYVSAKHGLIGLTKTTALEVGADGVTVNAICPAYVRTPLVEGQVAAQAETLGLPRDEVVERVMLEPVPIKRLIEPHEVASVALFLASEAGAAITGAQYTIDLGWTAR